MSDIPKDDFPTSVELVPATDDDIPEVVRLTNLAYRGSDGDSAEGWSTREKYLTGDRTTEKLLRNDLSVSPHASLLIWRLEGESGIVGSVWLEPQGDGNWYLGSLAVDPARQNGGLGKKLLSLAEDWVRERGGRHINITVINVRETLIGWYERRGYYDMGEREPFPYGDDRFGVPQRDDLCFVKLQKKLV
ncbi:MAG: GNAT family N-acetyltransferase [Paraburkholderia tropica]|uniref:Ribosomal protein S18 acetylase RimI-like enzyme n=1 Tax=Paraburkholderia tropica TaxID=92647 RepID=A0ABX5MK31_9BURK|nr:GNAT family N-acetyltransferase [Paraburkholderia tropica]PXX12562.1 ribosomal protein S18 acetylase RimI-like enzyme [Paraburkholderia tropica]PZW76539.1 ribosomal protein S18 acetylase RimI-like enzyme [Paraburkholderia tropica]